MYEATYELLERLTNPLIHSAYRLLQAKPEPEEGRAILADVHHLEALLDKAKAELKGGA